jgi:uncharacterized protein YeaO (DUF488 family)
MIRLLGFLLGSAGSIGLFLLILGLPDINLSTPVISDDQLESVSQTAIELKTDLEAIVTELANEVTDQETEQLAESVIEQAAAEPTIAESAMQEAGQEIDPVVPAEPQMAGLSPEIPTENARNTATQNDLKWHSFWNPFRSELAANGFVGQLEKVTGLDYRVVKIKTGVYEVTFAYANDDERRNKMSVIASATGLDLPES